MKVLHLKTLKSVSLPIFTARISNLDELDKEPNTKRKQEVTIKKSKTFHKTTLEPLVLWLLFMQYRSNVLGLQI